MAHDRLDILFCEGGNVAADRLQCKPALNTRHAINGGAAQGIRIKRRMLRRVVEHLPAVIIDEAFRGRTLAVSPHVV
jgi:hypothetical protein